MKLIFVHGRSQEKQNPEKLKAEWMKALQLGLDKSGLKLPISKDKIEFPYYGDQLADMSKDFISSKVLPAKKAEFYGEFLLEIANHATKNKKSKSIHSAPKIEKKGIQNWEWVQSILRGVDELTPFGESALSAITHDVYVYLTNTAVRKSIDDLVKKTISAEPCVVVGHSLGTVVCYNVLNSLSKNKVQKLITIGSPLGMNSIKKYLGKPLSMPKCVLNGWYNAFDERDVVALNPLDKKYFPILPSIINKKNVDNHTKNRHGVEGYLDDKVVAKKIYDSLILTY